MLRKGERNTVRNSVPDDRERSRADSLSLLQRGRIDEAIAAQARLRRLHPDRGDFFFAQAFHMLCHDDDAALHNVVMQALSRHCEPYFTQLFQALRCQLGQQYEQALAHAAEAHALRPQLPFALVVAAFVQLRQHRYTEAFDSVSEAMLRMEAPPSLRLVRLRCLEMTAPANHSQRLVEAALEYLAQPLLNHDRVAALACALIVHELKPDAHDDGAIIDAALGCQLLPAALERIICRNATLERFLVRLRRVLLALLHQRDDVSDAVLELAARLAVQCFYNEYVYEELADETRRVGELMASVGQSLASGNAVPARVLALALYRPLHRVQGIERLATQAAPALAQLIETTVTGPRTVQALMPSVPAFGGIDDVVSLQVRQQYEHNPYPRWIGFDRLAPRQHYAQTMAQRLRLQGLAAPRLPTAANGTRILVAGCGTGEQALALAFQHEDAFVTAVDISRASLAYAMYMAQRHRVANIEFAQCDILSIGTLQKTFDVIESVGVLQHMDSPAAGLKALTCVLAPGGVLRIGIYSEPARQRINAIRQRLAGDLSMRFDPDGLRALRRKLIEQKEDALLQHADFYTSSGCRDLLCHVHEHQFTIAGLQQLLQACDLQFGGFDFHDRDPAMLAMLRQRFGARKLDDLAGWGDIEAQMPELFSGMYVFYAYRRD